jgi:hypothetical protein
MGVNEQSLVGKVCKITSDGTLAGTKVLDPDGKGIPYVQKIEILLDCEGDTFTEVRLTLIAEIDIEAKVTEVNTKIIE